MKDNAFRFAVAMAAFLFASLLADASAPRWAIYVPLAVLAAYMVYDTCRLVKREMERWQ